MRIILHIGAWKTGSSAIQYFLAAATDALRAHGVVMPADAATASGRGRILKQLSGTDEDAAAVIAEIIQLKADGAKLLVLSNEHYWPLPERAIQQIGHRLKAISDDVEVLIYIRPQEDMWRSLHSQQAKKFAVKTGAAIWGTADYLPPVFAERAVHYHQTLQLYADAFGQRSISVRLYDRARFIGGDVVTDFLSHLGLDWTQFKREDRDINRSVGWKGVAFAVWLADEVHKALEDLNPERKIGQLYFRTVKHVADRFDDENWIGRAADPMTTAEKAAIRSYYQQDNERLYATYFDGEDVFSQPGQGRGDPVAPDAVPRGEMVVAKRRFMKLAQNKGFKIDGVEHLLLPPRPRARGLKRLMNALPFRTTNS